MKHFQKIEPKASANNRGAIKVLLLIFATSFISGCFFSGECYPSARTKVVPITLDRDSYESPYYLQESRSINKNGKIIVYGDYLVINEPKKGLHIYNNAVTTAPEPIGFIAIPGNTEAVVKNGFLIANNYTDLITFSLSNGDFVELSRATNTLGLKVAIEDYDRYGVDPEEEVIIGSRRERIGTRCDD